ncbi:MAG: hypothetical protein LBT40_16700 [Deltaproteobacteria bacterium]|jgi:hypothetical protein|nr:hypothetical protein [Deltaproteobacteria bacterium]
MAGTLEERGEDAVDGDPGQDCENVRIDWHGAGGKTFTAARRVMTARHAATEKKAAAARTMATEKKAAPARTTASLRRKKKEKRKTAKTPATTGRQHVEPSNRAK